MTITESLKPHQKASEYPTTRQLQAMYPVNEQALAGVEKNRQRLSRVHDNPGADFIVAMGECGVVSGLNAKRIRRREGHRLRRLSEASGALVMQRLNIWKPRSKQDDWHGLETTDPELAYESVVNAVNRGVAVTMEIFYEEQLDRYGDLLSAMWFGSRSIDNPELREALIEMAVKHHSIPVGVKNGLDGNTEAAENLISEINQRRKQKAEESAPAFLIYRGGTDYRTPQSVERKIREVIDCSEGKVVIDTAHGVESAFDPCGNFKKSVVGQISALAMTRKLQGEGCSFMGLLVEASDNKGQTDPNIPFSQALRIIRQIIKVNAAN